MNDARSVTEMTPRASSKLKLKWLALDALIVFSSRSRQLLSAKSDWHSFSASEKMPEQNLGVGEFGN